jgi:hypothetical protein
MTERKKWYKRWYGKLGIGGFLTTIISENIKEYTKNIPILKYIILFFTSIYSFISRFLNLEVKVWIIGVLLIVISGTVWLFVKLSGSQEPPYRNYTSEVFRSWLWRWTWKHYEDGWKLEKLRPYCRGCETQLVISRDYWGATAKCPKCGQQFSESQNSIEYTEEIEKLIISEAERQVRANGTK